MQNLFNNLTNSLTPLKIMVPANRDKVIEVEYEGVIFDVHYECEYNVMLGSVPYAIEWKGVFVDDNYWDDELSANALKRILVMANDAIHEEYQYHSGMR